MPFIDEKLAGGFLPTQDLRRDPSEGESSGLSTVASLGTVGAIGAGLYFAPVATLGAMAAGGSAALLADEKGAGAAFRTENIVGSSLVSKSLGYSGARDPEFDPWADIAGTDFEPHWERFTRARNKEHADLIRSDIEREKKDRQYLESNGALGFAQAMAAGLFDLPSLLPGGAVVRNTAKGVSRLRSAANVATFGAAGAGLTEGVLQATQQLRTPEESAMNIAGATILSGVLGYGMASKMSGAERAIIGKRIERDFTPSSQRDPVTDGLDDLELQLRAAAEDMNLFRIPGFDLEVVDAIAVGKDSMFALRGFHSSPNDFSAVSGDFQGSGQGQAMHGPGIYIGSSENIAKFFGRIIASKAGDLSKAAKSYLNMHEGDFSKVADVIARRKTQFRGEALKDLDRVEADLKKSPSGYLYELAIGAEPDSIVRADDQLSSQPIGAKLLQLIGAYDAKDIDVYSVSRLQDYNPFLDESGNIIAPDDAGNLTGAQAIALLRLRGLSNKDLADNGIYGLEYTEVDYSIAGEKSYVIFDPEIIRIAQKQQGMYALRAFHGSPHDFDKFDLSRIGTGEGAQAFGHGLYFAESELTAQAYQKQLAGPERYQLDGKDLPENANPFALRNYAQMRMDGNKAGLSDEALRLRKSIKSIEDRLKANEYDNTVFREVDQLDLRNLTDQLSALKKIESGNITKSLPGSLYEVEIDVEPEQLLDWDLPLSKQNEPIKAAIEKAIGPKANDPLFRRMFLDQGKADVAYGALVGILGSPDAASAALREAGIPGIRYLDQGSRGTGDGTRNIVLFDDSLVKITRKNGKPVTGKERQGVIDEMFALRGFYSPAIRAAEQLNQKKGTGEQFWKQITKVPGVRKDELEWMGLEEFLMAAPEPSVKVSPKERGDAEVNTPEFQRWFAGSKVAEQSGNPLVVYSGQRDEQSGESVWLTDDRNHAEGFGDVASFHVRIKDPFILDMRDFASTPNLGRVQDQFIRGYDLDPETWVQDLQEVLDKGGWDADQVVHDAVRFGNFDGAILDNWEGLGKTYLARHRDQVREVKTSSPSEPSEGSLSLRGTKRFTKDEVLAFMRAHQVDADQIESRLQEIGSEILRLQNYAVLKPKDKQLLSDFRDERKRLIRSWEELPLEARAGKDSLFALRAFHGSPHDFDQFRLDRIGTGEGAQAFGHGLYFAENELVAKEYRDFLAEDARLDPKVDGKDFDETDPVHVASVQIFYNKSREKAIRQLSQFEADAIKNPDDPYWGNIMAALRLLRSDKKIPEYETGGKLYEVEIDVEPEQLLDWDLPLSKQSAEVKKALEKIGIKGSSKEEARSFDDALLAALEGDASVTLPKQPRDPSGEEIIRQLHAKRGSTWLDPNKSAEQQVSAALRKAGVPGIRFLDQFSRGAGEGSRNIVIFDDSLVKITRKNGRPVSSEERQDVIDLMMGIRRQQDAEPIAEGKFDREKLLVTISRAALDPVGTLRHEAIHALRAVDLFSPREWKALSNAASRKGWLDIPEIRDYEKIYGKARTDETIIEEAVAMAFQRHVTGVDVQRGVIGTAFARLKNFLERLANALQGRGLQTEQDIFNRILQGDIGARAGPETGSSVRTTAPVFTAAGAQKSAEGDIRLKGALGAEKALAFLSPAMRLQNSPAREARAWVNELAETALTYEDHKAWIPTARGGAELGQPGAVETRVKLWDANIAEGFRELDNLFMRYRKGSDSRKPGDLTVTSLRDAAAGPPQGKLDYRQFREQVSAAMRRNDEHEIPEIAEAAKFLRANVFDPLLKRAVELEMLPEGVTPETAPSYLNRIYNHERIVAERPDFRNVIVKWLQENEIQNAMVRGRVSSLLDEFKTKQNKLKALGQKIERRTQRLAEMERAGEEVSRFNKFATERSIKMSEPIDEIRTEINTITAKIEEQLTRIQELSGEIRTQKENIPGLQDVERQMQALSRALSDVRKRTEFIEQIEDAGDIEESIGELATSFRDALGRLKEEARDLRIGNDGEDGSEAGQVLKALENERARLSRRVAPFQKQLRALRADQRTLERRARPRASEGNVYRNRIAGRVNTLADQISGRRGELESLTFEQTNRTARLNEISSLIEEQINAYRGKSASEAQASIKRRDAAEAERTPEQRAKKSRLTGADADVMRAARRIAAQVEKEPGEIEDLAEQIIDRILGTPEGRLPYDAHMDKKAQNGVAMDTRGPLAARDFMIPDERIEQWLENDIDLLMRAYVHTMAADTELMARFGSVDMMLQFKQINEEYARLANATNDPKERKRLHDRKKQDFLNLAAIRDRIRGTYALPEDPDALTVRAIRGMMTLNYMRMLGGMTISAIPDVSRFIHAHGVVRTFGDGIIPMFRSWAKYKKAGDEAKLLSGALEMITDNRAMRLADITDTFGRHTKFERGIQSAGRQFGMVSLMAPWNSVMKQVAGSVTQSRILRGAEQFVSGKALKQSEIEYFADLGISEGALRQIGEQFKKHGNKEAGVWSANTAEWDEGSRTAIDALRVGLRKEVDRIIVTPSHGEKPRFASTLTGAMLLQFKSFAISATQKMLISGLQQRDLNALNAAVMAVALGGMVHILKGATSGRPVEVDWDDDQQVRQFIGNAFDRSGLAGVLMEFNNVAEKVTDGRVGLSALTGKPISRYASRNVTASLLGPAVGLAEDSIKAANAALGTREWKARDTHNARQLLPYNNLFFMRSIFDNAEAGINEAFGVPEK